jgi:hypothetical protein
VSESAKERAERRRLEAVTSAFMRVPRLPLDVARDLLDAGYTRLDQVAGRSAETLLSEIRRRNPEASDSHLPALRLAIYVAETPRPDPSRLFLDRWT